MLRTGAGREPTEDRGNGQSMATRDLPAGTEHRPRAACPALRGQIYRGIQVRRDGGGEGIIIAKTTS